MTSLIPEHETMCKTISALVQHRLTGSTDTAWVGERLAAVLQDVRKANQAEVVSLAYITYLEGKWDEFFNLCHQTKDLEMLTLKTFGYL